MHRFTGIGSLSVVFLFPCALQASGITLDFTSLPSAQGWTYDAAGSHAGTPENDVFLVASNTLVSNTMGQGFGFGPGGIEYFRSGVVNSSDPAVLELRVRVTDTEGDQQSYCYGFGFNFGLRTGTHFYQIGLTTTHVRVDCGAPLAAVDNTQFHDYRLELTPGSPASVYIDNVLVGLAPAHVAASPEGLFIGDGTGITNARAEVTYYRFIQTGPIPTRQSSWGKVKSLYR